MIVTDHYIRWQRVDSVARTATGIMAELHGERLSIDVARADVLRIKISRGGAFDEPPTFAVCVDPLASPADFLLEQDDERVQLITDVCRAALWLDPFRIEVHRSDGSPVIETAPDPDGRYWAYATLNDSFTIRRRCRQEDAIFGLGEKSGRHNRKGREFTLWNTDVLSPYETVEFTAGRAPDDPRGDFRSVEFDPYYVSIPFFYHQSYPDGRMAASFVDNGYRGEYEFSRDEEYRLTFRGGQYTEYVFAGPDMPAILESYTWLTGRTAPPPLWSLGYHQCRWFSYTQDAVEAVAQRHRDNDIPCDAVWLDIEYMAGYRVFTWDRDRFPDPPGMLKHLDEKGFRVITIIDPGVKFDPGYWVFDQALEQDVLCRTEGGDLYLGQVWPGNTAFPDFVTEEARAWWGELNAAHVRYGLAGIWNDMNEPATGNISALPMRFDRGRHSHERYHNQYALLMAMGTTAGLLNAMPDRRTLCCPAPLCRDPALCRELDGRQPVTLGPPVAEHPDGSRLRYLGAGVCGSRHRRVSRQLERGALLTLDAVRHPDSVLSQSLRDRQCRSVRMGIRRRRSRSRPDRDQAAISVTSLSVRLLPEGFRVRSAGTAATGLRSPIRCDSP